MRENTNQNNSEYGHLGTQCMCNDNTEVERIILNDKQIFHAFLSNIRNYSPELRNIQRRKVECVTKKMSH